MTRELGMAFTAVVGFVIVTGIGIWAWMAGGWMLWFLAPVALLLMVLAYGIGDSVQLKDRSKRNPS